MTMGKKIYLSFAGATAVAILASLGSYMTTQSLGDTVNSLVNRNARRQYLAGQMELGAEDLLSMERAIALRAYIKDFATLEQYNRDFAARLTAFTHDIDEFRPLIATEQGRKAIQEISAVAMSIGPVHQEFYRVAASGDVAGAAAFLSSRLLPDLTRSRQTAHGLLTLQNDLMQKVTASTEDSVTTDGRIALIMILLSISIGAVIVFVVRRINRSLQQTVHELSQGADQVASAAGQVASTSQAIAQGATEQAASLEETSSASEQIRALARESVHKTQSAAGLVGKAQEAFGETNVKFDQMVAAMEAINASSSKISKIIKVIDEIAFQTNILALNAAVEAARAGEAGMGFAVVADEVRSLAQRCAQAAGDTSALIEESIARFGDGKAKVDEVAASIRILSGEAAQVKELVEEVSAGSTSETQGIEQVANAVSQMQGLTQSSAASAEEGAAAAEELTAQSQSLRSAVGNLAALVGGVA